MSRAAAARSEPPASSGTGEAPGGVPPHYYAAPSPRARDEPCARCGRDAQDPIHLKPKLDF